MARVTLPSIPASSGVLGCITVRHREAEWRAEMEAYTFSYAYPEGKWPSSQDKRTLRELDAEGWHAVREERSVKDGTVTITIFYERQFPRAETFTLEEPANECIRGTRRSLTSAQELRHGPKDQVKHPSSDPLASNALVWGRAPKGWNGAAVLPQGQRRLVIQPTTTDGVAQKSPALRGMIKSWWLPGVKKSTRPAGGVPKYMCSGYQQKSIPRPQKGALRSLCCKFI